MMCAWDEDGIYHLYYKVAYDLDSIIIKYVLNASIGTDF